MPDIPQMHPDLKADTHPAGREQVTLETIRAAADLFAERNPSQVSVREIAQQAGVSHALVHRYLGTKDEIFRAALKRLRDEAAEYWTHTHGAGRTSDTLRADLPPGRYVRAVVRAALEGVPMTAEDMKFPHADRMLALLESGPLPGISADDAPFDPRLLFSAVIAMATGMAIAEEFFLVQSGLENENRDKVHAEMARLIMRIMALADQSQG
jgi:AcrR family transcriptional regulator